MTADEDTQGHFNPAIDAGHGVVQRVSRVPLGIAALVAAILYAVTAMLTLAIGFKDESVVEHLFGVIQFGQAFYLVAPVLAIAALQLSPGRPRWAVAALLVWTLGFVLIAIAALNQARPWESIQP